MARAVGPAPHRRHPAVRPSRHRRVDFKAPPTAAAAGWARRAISPLYLVAPIAALAVWLDHPHVRSWAALLTAAAFGITFVVLHAADLRRLHHGRVAAFPPGRILVQMASAVAALAATAVGLGLHGGAWVLLTAVPYLAVALVGNRSMLLCGWVVLTAALAVEAGTQLPALHALSATVAASGASVVVAAMVDRVVRGAIHGVYRTRALAELSAHASTMQDWPRGLAAIGDNLARAMDVAAFAVLQRAGPSAPLERVMSWPAADWPSWKQLSSLPDRAVRQRRAMNEGGLLATPARAGPATVVVVTPSTSVRRVPVEVTVTAMVASLLAAMAERTRLITGLVDLAHTDELTGLANRRRLFDALDQEITRARRSARPFSVAMVDLDHFKRYNDTFGHAAGDELLRRFAFRMTRRVRAQDLVARYGGEEFCLVLPETEGHGALALVEKLRRAGTGEDPLGRRVTFSAGVATWDGVEASEDLVLRADGALYRAKDAGRDCVVADPTPRHMRAVAESAGR